MWAQYAPNPKQRARPKSHPQVGFHVDDAAGKERIFRTWDEAAGFAVVMASSGKEDVYLDVVIWTESGARWWAGDHGVEQFREDPDASVSERYKIKVEDQGRVR